MTLAAFADDFAPFLLRQRPRPSAASTRLAPVPVQRSATTTQLQQPLWSASVTRQLVELLELEDGWDGPGSIAPTIEAAQRTLDVLVAIAKPNTRPPKIAPVSDGTLQLVWYAGGVELEISVDHVGVVDIGLFDVASQTEEEGVTLQDPRLAVAIGKLSA